SLLCTCSLLDKLAQDAKVPITREGTSAGYVLQLSDSKSVRMHVCHFCGGRDRDRVFAEMAGMLARSGPECSCGSVAAWAADPELWTEYDPQMNEYSQEGVGIFYYCVACGGQMPETRRDTFFAEPSAAEERDFLRRTPGLRTL